jgi:ankyrin repeat protein
MEFAVAPSSPQASSSSSVREGDGRARGGNSRIAVMPGAQLLHSQASSPADVRSPGSMGGGEASGVLPAAPACRPVGSDQDRLDRHLLDACEADDHAAVLVCIDTAFPVARSEDGLTAQHYAAIHGWPDIMQRLLAKGSPNVVDNAGRTPLFLAAVEGEVGVVRVLEQDPRTQDVKNREGERARDRVASFPPEGDLRRTLEPLLESIGERYFTVPFDDLSLLSPGRAGGQRPEPGDASASKDVNQRFRAAVRDGDERTCVALCHEPGLDLHSASRKGRTPLHHAAATGNVDLAEMILFKLAADGSVTLPRDEDGKTPLHFAVEALQPEMVALFDRFGVVDEPDNQGRHAFDCLALLRGSADTMSASDLDRLENVELQMHTIVQCTLYAKLQQALIEGDQPLVDALRPQVNVFEVSKATGESLVHLAARIGNAAFVEAALLDAPLPEDPTAQRDAKGRFLMHHAVDAMQPEVMRVLVEDGRAVDRHDRKDRLAYAHLLRRMDAVREAIGSEAAERLLKHATEIHERTVFRQEIAALPYRWDKEPWSDEALTRILATAWPYEAAVRSTASEIWEKLQPGSVPFGKGIVDACLQLAQRYHDEQFQSWRLVQHYGRAGAGVPDFQPPSGEPVPVTARDILKAFGGDLSWVTATPAAGRSGA